MDRRQFIVKSGAFFTLPLLITQVGCGYGDDDSPTAPTDSSGNTFSIISSNNSGHTHSVTIKKSSVDDPPEMSITLTSSGSHTHQITLTHDNYHTLLDGGVVNKTSTSSSGHTHTFAIKVP